MEDPNKIKYIEIDKDIFKGMDFKVDIDVNDFACTLCGGTHKVVSGRGTEDEEVEDCPACSLSEEADFTGPELGDKDR